MNKAAVRQKRNYNKRLAGRSFVIDGSLWLHNVRRMTGRNAKLDCPLEGPYLVISVLLDVVYRIQNSRKPKPKVVHSDRLKPYLGPPTGGMDSNKAEVGNEPKITGERNSGCRFFNFCRRQPVSSG